MPGGGIPWDDARQDDVQLSRSGRVVWLLAALLFAGLLWAWMAELDEVATSQGTVVPTSREQVIQSLEGGILARLMVREDEVVEPGQILAELDPAITEADLEENAARYRAALASSTRLRAEVSGTELVFPVSLDGLSALRVAETELYQARQEGLEQTLYWIGESITLVQSELDINQSLSDMGASSNVEVLRLQRQLTELELQQQEIQADYTVRAREELAKADAEVEALSSVVRGGADRLTRLTLRSPVRGIVKNIEVSTIGGVVPPNGQLMVIVPLEDELLVEARVQPRDIAFIRPGRRASVKITAYDYSIYGGLEGTVTSISPDTIQDEIEPGVHYYRVFVRTESDALVNELGVRFPIVPGMIATADIYTGSKTVLNYLLKPLNRVREALRER